MRLTEWKPDGEGRPAADFASGVNGTAMQLDEFINQCEADSTTFVGASLLPLDSMKSLEQPWHFVLGYADAGIGDRKLDHSTSCAERNRQLAFEGELESIGEQVEDDLFPHIPVDIDRFG